MVLGRLLHYTLDAIMLSTVVAGIRRSSGFEPQTALIPEQNIRSVAESFLGVGETIFDIAQATAVSSSYWRRGTK